MMIDYHRWLVRRRSSGSYQPERPYELAVILLSPTVPLVVTITCGFNNTNDDRGIGDRSECSSVGTIGIILLVPKVPISFTSHVCYHLTNGKRVHLLERQGIIEERGGG
jgi:hypothetical protein